VPARLTFTVAPNSAPSPRYRLSSIESPWPELSPRLTMRLARRYIFRIGRHRSLTNREVLVLSVGNDESNVALRLRLHLCVCCRAARAMTV
jgi:hypothetical protein